MSIIQNSGNNSGGSKAEASDQSRSPQGPDMLNSARVCEPSFMSFRHAE
jgi:hypothetical protein